MPVQLLVSATTHAKQTKGQVLVVRDEPTEWGTGEVPPKYVRVRLTDATAAQVESFLEWVVNRPEYAVQTLPNLDKQITITMPQKIIDLFGAHRGLTIQLREHLESIWGAQIVSHIGNAIVMNVPAVTVLADLKADFLDQFEQRVGPRWLFTSASVDQALSLGGMVELTRAQAQARLIDRLA